MLGANLEFLFNASVTFLFLLDARQRTVVQPTRVSSPRSITHCVTGEAAVECYNQRGLIQILTLIVIPVNISCKQTTWKWNTSVY